MCDRQTKESINESKARSSLQSREKNEVFDIFELETLLSDIELEPKFPENIFYNVSDDDENRALSSSASTSTIDVNDIFYYKNLSVFPEEIDFSGVEKSITPNIIDGPYPSVEHYLDLQFKLLREDCFRPIVEGINHYKRHKSVKYSKGIRVYRRVCIIDSRIINGRVGYVVDLRISKKDLEVYKDAKTFMHGSLLIFTRDDFKTMLYATVLYQQSKRRIIVSFEMFPTDVFLYEFLMVESEVFFEPYHRVLKVLQNSSTISLPMERYIVYTHKHINPPSYLTSDTTYSVKNANNKKIYFQVLHTNWPTSDVFGLDESQMDAFKFALTKEFVVIQGPPGTGKTFLGTKIAGMLLQNVYFKQSPMLIICCTNHALDQFLEGLLKYTNSIVRLGGQSKSDILQIYNLKKLRNPKSFSIHYRQEKVKLNDLYKKVKTVSLEIELTHNSIISYETLKQYSIDPFILDRYKEDPIIDWLFGHSTNKLNNCNDNNYVAFDDMKICFSEKMALDEIKKLENILLELEKSDTDTATYQKTMDICEKKIEEYERKLAVFKEMFANRHKIVEIPKTKNLYDLKRNERWALYFKLVDLVRTYLIEKKRNLYSEYLEIIKVIEDLRNYNDCKKLKNMKVVGMTTTMAARRHELLKMLKSFVVIVEEAAEVLETHIVASLTKHCKHLILIGDHQQLRPSSSHYVIGKKFNLEVSLFERMIQNGVQSKTLTTQRRMRKNIMDLLVPTIYDKLVCHPSVLLYSDVRGMKVNLFFFNHNTYEDTVDAKRSCKNMYEANYSVQLANHLMSSGYDPKEVTILTTYTAQVMLMSELSENYELLKDVNITTVDSFQGEESRIVILSLVRSNEEKKIGFLAIANRVCVALSRAKEGLYIFGNMSCLEISPLWREIKVKLENQNAIKLLNIIEEDIEVAERIII